MRTTPITTFALTSSLLFAASSVSAQDEPIEPPVLVQEEMRGKALGVPGEEETKTDGWSVKANVGATGTYSHSSNVVGSEDGSTLQIGGVFGTTAVLRKGQHEWENIFDFKITETKTPQLEDFVKSQDELNLKSTYLYHLLDPNWAGGFGRLKLQTSLLPGATILSAPTTLSRTNKIGETNIEENVPAQTKVDLTSAFEPLVLRETIGLFANPIEEERLTFKSKLGLAVQHLLTRNGYTIVDNEETPELELLQLDNAHEFGTELTLDLNGVLVKDLLSWKAGAEFFFPFVSDANRDIEGIDRLNSDLLLGLSLKLLSWLSLDYNVTAKRVPLVLEEWQVVNGFILSAGFTIL